MADKDALILTIDGKQIAECTSLSIPTIECKDSRWESLIKSKSIKVSGTITAPSEFAAYMKRKNKIYFRNYLGDKLILELHDGYIKGIYKQSKITTELISTI